VNHPETRAKAKGLCNACYVKKRYEADPVYRAKRIETAKAWHAANPERSAAMFKKSKSKACPIKKRDYLLRKKYGITFQDFVDILAEQNGACALCFKAPNPDKQLHVDHCHDTGCVRGLLCHQCNWYLGKVDKDPSLLDRMKNYRENHD
jgi:hypothetical protein